MLMILEHVHLNKDVAHIEKTVLDIDCDFFNFREYKTMSGKEYCEVLVNTKSNIFPTPIRLNIIGNLQQVVDTINKAIADVKRRYS